MSDFFLESVSRPATQFDVVTAPIFEESFWDNFNWEVRYLAVPRFPRIHPQGHSGISRASLSADTF